ncbi:DUF2530 domain-containing protein [Pseudonocardiaceae bacterium YIM PH 21723]|nr:DUF2530 domain-containing protein [Pseudonocardiaceae bacterium YIM PH 21723]
MSDTEEQQERPLPPALPDKLNNPVPVVIIGSALWAVGFVVLLLARFAFDQPPTVWLWVCLCGLLLGALGYGVFFWQRSAHRRGSKTAQEIL